MGGVQTQILTPTPPSPHPLVQSVEEVWTAFGLNLLPKAPGIFFLTYDGG